MTLKKIIAIKLTISVFAIVCVAFLTFSIISALIYIIDEEGHSNVSEKATERIIEENLDIAESSNGSYFKLPKDFLDKFLEELNRSYFYGQFFDKDAEENEKEFIYDPDDADIKEEDLINWFRTEDYDKYLMKMIKAQIASSYPKMSNYNGEDGTEDEFGNRLDADGNYVIQGIVKIKRNKITKDRGRRWRSGINIYRL